MKIILAVMAMALFVWWIVPNDHDYTKKPNYNKSVWLRIDGNVTKGYIPYLALNYYTQKDECRVQLDDYNLMWLLFDPVIKVLIQGYDGKKAGHTKRIADARMSGSARYLLRYPKNYYIDGCEFMLGSAFLRIREEPNSSPRSYEDENDTLVLRYDVIGFNYPDRNMQLNGTYNCQNEEASSTMVCQHLAENSDNSFDLYTYELKSNKPFSVDISVGRESIKNY